MGLSESSFEQLLWIIAIACFIAGAIRGWRKNR